MGAHPFHRHVLTGLAFVAATVALDWISLIHPFSPLGFFKPWNPGAGLTFTFVLLTPTFNALWIVPAVLLTDLLIRGWPLPPLVEIQSITIIMLGYGGAAWLLKRMRFFDLRLHRLNDLMVMFAIAAPMTLVTALGRSSLFAANDLLAWSDVDDAAISQWVGNLIGIAVVTPLLLRLYEWQRSGLPRPRPNFAELALQCAAIPIALWAIFGQPQGDTVKYFYLLFLPIVWIAVRYGLDGAVGAAALMQVGLILALEYQRYGREEVVDFQVLMLVLASTGLIVGAIVSERRDAQDALLQYEHGLRERQWQLANFGRASLGTELTSSLAHELSQPLAATSTYIGICRRLLAAAPVEKLGGAMDALAEAESSARRAGSVLTALRDLFGRSETRLRDVPVAQLLASVASLAAAESAELGKFVAARDASGGASVKVDRIQIELALLNLTRNALEAMSESSEANKRLKITAHARRETVDIEVADSGRGIPAEIADRLFQPFVTTRPEGMGLGLAISRSIAEAHGGKLTFEPRATGGSLFRLTLQRADRA